MSTLIRSAVSCMTFWHASSLATGIANSNAYIDLTQDLANGPGIGFQFSDGASLIAIGLTIGLLKTVCEGICEGICEGVCECEGINICVCILFVLIKVVNPLYNNLFVSFLLSYLK